MTNSGAARRQGVRLFPAGISPCRPSKQFGEAYTGPVEMASFPEFGLLTPMRYPD
jgi:hypothetical protein